MDMLYNLIPNHIYDQIKEYKNITELRLRIGSIIKIALNGKYFPLLSNNIGIKCTKSDILHILRVSTKNSLYSYENSITNGYIEYFGYRIGICGEGIINDNKVLTISNVTSLCIRVPHNILCIPKSLNYVINNFNNTLVISKPGCGKTTLIRALSKKLSELDNNVLILDERGEISFDNTIDLGPNTDIVLNIQKNIAYSSFVRVMNPDLVVTDEIFGEYEVNCLIDLVRCGVKVMATLHSNSLDTINQKMYVKLLSIMRYIIIIKDIGVIDKVIDRGTNENSNI